MKKNKENLSEFLTVRELAQWIKLSESHIYFMVNKKKIPFAKLGGKLLFEREKIRKWIESNSNTVTPVKKKKEKTKAVVESVEPVFLVEPTGIAVGNGTANENGVLVIMTAPLSEIIETKTANDVAEAESGN
jgi:excisionase family DNA binding protein